MSRRRPAQAGLEFALAMPILLLLILGVLDAGRVVIAAVSLNNAAREGARYAALHVYDGTCSNASANCLVEVRGIVANVALGVDTTQLRPFTVSVTGTPPSIVRVALSYPFAAISPLIGSAVGDVNVTASSSMLAR